MPQVDLSKLQPDVEEPTPAHPGPASELVIKESCLTVKGGIRVLSKAGKVLFAVGEGSAFVPPPYSAMKLPNRFEVLDRIELSTEDNLFVVKDSDGNPKSIIIDGKNNALVLRNKTGADTVWIHGDPANGGSGIDLRNQAGTPTVAMDGENNVLRVRNDSGNDSVIIDGKNNAMVLQSKAGAQTVWIHGDKDNGGSGIDLRNQSGTPTVTLDGERGDILLHNADCAEDFDVLDTQGIEPGTVMVIDSDGKLCQSTEAYNKKVAGVISGAGDLKPGMVMDRQPSQSSRLPISLMGKVYCKVDAEFAPIEVGDLLTTSSTAGHAMKAADPLKAFGAVIGKALRPLREGRGLIPILIALQ